MWKVLLVLLPTTALADDIPILPNLMPLKEGVCIDEKSNEQGGCYLFAGDDGFVYLFFEQDGHLMFVRKVSKTGNEDIYVAPGFATY